jgi:hypothetical protein
LATFADCRCRTLNIPFTLCSVHVRPLPALPAKYRTKYGTVPLRIASRFAANESDVGDPLSNISKSFVNKTTIRTKQKETA